MKVKGVISDFDGTLVDSEELHVAAWNDVAAELSVPKGEVDFYTFIGRSDKTVTEYLLSNYETGWTFDEIFSCKQRFLRERVTRELRPFQGVIAALTELKAKGVPVIVATNSIRDYYEHASTVAGVKDYVLSAVCADDVIEKKPNPEMFLKAQKVIGIPKDECVVIEDSVDGVRGANNAGIFCFAVANSYGKDDLAHADAFLTVFDDILSYV